MNVYNPQNLEFKKTSCMELIQTLFHDYKHICSCKLIYVGFIVEILRITHLYISDRTPCQCETYDQLTVRLCLGLCHALLLNFNFHSMLLAVSLEAFARKRKVNLFELDRMLCPNKQNLVVNTHPVEASLKFLDCQSDTCDPVARTPHVKYVAECEVSVIKTQLSFRRSVAYIISLHPLFRLTQFVC